MENSEWRRIEQVAFALGGRMPSDRFDFTDAEIVLVFLRACFFEKSIRWACRRSSWPVYHRRRLPSETTMCRRARDPRFLALLEALRVELEAAGERGLVHIMDGKPLFIASHSEDRESTFGGPGGRRRGYKLHSLCTPEGLRRAWAVRPLNVCEKEVAKELLQRACVQGYVLGDTNYHSTGICELAESLGIQMLAPRERPGTGLGHHRRSQARMRCLDMVEFAPTPFSKDLFAQRRRIETMHANLTSFSGGLIVLPPWARGLRRVTNWVAGKLVLDAARRERVRARKAV
jgi:hypothetical protein